MYRRQRETRRGSAVGVHATLAQSDKFGVPLLYASSRCVIDYHAARQPRVDRLPAPAPAALRDGMDLLQIVKREGGTEGGRQGEADGSLTLEKREPSLPLTFESVRLSDSIDFENDGSE